MKNILQKLKELRTARLVSRIKHLRGRHDQRDHNRWPAGYVAQTYTPTGRRADAISARTTGGLASMTRANIMMNQTKRLTPQVKTGEPSLFAPMPIDTSELQPGGLIYQMLTDIESSQLAQAIYGEIENIGYDNYIAQLKSANSPLAVVISPSDSTYLHFATRSRPLSYGPPSSAYSMESMKNSWDLLPLEEFVPLDRFSTDKEVTRRVSMYRERAKKIQEMYEKLNKKIDDYGITLDDWNDDVDIRFGHWRFSNNREYVLATDLLTPNLYQDSRFHNIWSRQDAIAISTAVDNYQKQYDAVKSALDDLMQKRIDANIPYFSFEGDTVGGTEKHQYVVLDKDAEDNIKAEKEKLENAKQDLFLAIQSAMENRKEYKENLGNDDEYDSKADEDLESRSVKEWTDILTQYHENGLKIAEVRSNAFEIRNHREDLRRIANSIVQYTNIMEEYNKAWALTSSLNTNPFARAYLHQFGMNPSAIVEFYEEEGEEKTIESQQEFVSIMNEFFNVLENHAQKVDGKFRFDLRNGGVQEIQRYRSMVDAIGNMDIKEIFKFNHEDSDKNAMILHFFNSNSGRISSELMIQRALGFIYDMQSYNGKPAVVDWNTILNPQSGVVSDANGQPLTLMRSVHGVSWTDSTQQDRGFEYVDAMRYGETHYPGIGVSGYGTYMKSPSTFGNSRSDQAQAPDAQYFDEVDVLLQRAELELRDLQELINNSEEYKNRISNSEIDKLGSEITDSIKQMRTAVDRFNSDQSDVYARTQWQNDIHTYGFYSNENVLRFIGGEIESVVNNDMNPYTNPDGIEIVKAYNALHNTLKALRQVKRVYTKDEANYYALMATRANYGLYSTGYTLNADARIPQGYVNGGNSGNMNHERIISLDTQINDEFNRRYPMLAGIRINIGVKMAMLGYDAYPAHVNSHSTNWVILNRAILNVADTTIDPSYTDEEIHELMKWGKPVR